MTARHPLEYADDMPCDPPQVFSFGAALKEAAAPLARYERASEESLLANADAYSAWLSLECIGAVNVELGFVPSEHWELADYAAESPVPRLMAMLMYPRPGVQSAAAHELRLRFLAAHGVKS